MPCGRRSLFSPFVASALLAALGLSACRGPAFTGFGVATPSASSGVSPSGTTIAVVAAENFYGDIVQQLGAGNVSVVSILSDPNIDPHEYESSVKNGVAVSRAQLVVENGGDYDTWMDKLLSASPNPNRVVLVAANVANHQLPDNPHFWYGLDNIQTIAQAITGDLEKIDPSHRPAYDAALVAFRQSLAPIQQKINELSSKYAGNPVGLTETIFLYQSEPIGLKVLTPFEFEKAIAEGNDPPADTVVTTDDQITNHEVKILIYNVQTVTPVTTNLQQEASRLKIPVVPVSETMPPGKNYQNWMLDQLNALGQALGG